MSGGGVDVSGARRRKETRVRVGMIRNFGEECLFIGRRS